jgi:hypothetical protein
MRFLLYTILGLALIGAGLLVADKVMSDDYDNCTATFTTDKDIYQSGDSIELTLTIATKNKDKEIKLCDNFSNLEFSSHFTRTCYPDKPEVGDCAFQTMIDEKTTKIKAGGCKTYHLSADKPIKHTFIGKITFDTVSNRYTIVFPELRYQSSFDKREYKISKSYGFIGYLNVIKPAFGVSNTDLVVQYKSIKLKV